MSDHFKGKYEVELKFHVKNVDSLKVKLSSLNAENFVIENDEKDLYLELNEGELEKRNLSMVL